jgi:hypothetical protein
MTGVLKLLLDVKRSLLPMILLIGLHSCALESVPVYSPIEEQARNCRSGISLSKYKTKLRPAAINLMNEVETKFRKGVCVAEMKDWPPEQYGDSDVDDEGTPKIRINPIYDNYERERTIVHELFHLKFQADGFSRFRWILQGRVNEEMVTFIHVTFMDATEHYMFFPAIRKMGIDPSANLKASIQAGDYMILNRGDVTASTAYYYRATLLVDDMKIIAELANWYEKNGLNDALQTGEELAATVKNLNPKTPEDLLSAQLKVLKAVPGLTDRYEFKGGSEETLGLFTRRLANITVEPPR